MAWRDVGTHGSVDAYTPILYYSIVDDEMRCFSYRSSDVGLIDAPVPEARFRFQLALFRCVTNECFFG